MSRHLPDDIIFKILILLPFKALHKCKWLSKSWMDLITTHILKKPTAAGAATGYLVYQRHKAHLIRDDCGAEDPNVDFRLSFLSRHDLSKSLRVLDCRNGLILCTADKDRYYVCNPATKSWVVIPYERDRSIRLQLHFDLSPQYGVDPCLLEFNPWASPHYSILSVQPGGKAWSMYSSLTGRWSKTRFLGGYNSWLIGNMTLWHGDAYVVNAIFYNSEKVCIKTMKFCLAEGREEEISFPEIAQKLIVCSQDSYSKVRPSTHIGWIGDGVHFALLKGLDLTVWMLNGNEWVPRSTSNITDVVRIAFRKPRVVAFHSTPNSIFVSYKNKVHLYNLNAPRALEECPHFESEFAVQVFPFSLCQFEVFEG